MLKFEPPRPGAFCWLDLAASDESLAREFYARAFGWTFRDRPANGGRFTRCFAGEEGVGSLYPLRPSQLRGGVPSHWTPYLCVEDIDGSAQRIGPLGGRIVVAPFDVQGVARIALIEDAVGALVGMWQPLPTLRPARPTEAA